MSEQNDTVNDEPSEIERLDTIIFAHIDILLDSCAPGGPEADHQIALLEQRRHNLVMEQHLVAVRDFVSELVVLGTDIAKEVEARTEAEKPDRTTVEYKAGSIAITLQGPSDDPKFEELSQWITELSDEHLEMEKGVHAADERARAHHDALQKLDLLASHGITAPVDTNLGDEQIAKLEAEFAALDPEIRAGLLSAFKEGFLKGVADAKAEVTEPTT